MFGLKINYINMSKVDLKQLFNGLQQQMSAQLNTNREFIDHPGSKGDALENAWIDWLRKYLPNRYCVDKAIVIDHEGNTSQQMDIVIYDNWFTPFIFNQNGFHYIGVAFIPMVTSLIFPVFFQAVGAAVKSSLLTVVRTVVLFVPLGYLFSRLGLNDFWFTFPVTEVITTLVGVFFYRRFMAQQK
jgi:hypothetical protein